MHCEEKKEGEGPTSEDGGGEELEDGGEEDRSAEEKMQERGGAVDRLGHGRRVVLNEPNDAF